MTDPPRGLIKPAILGALTGIALVCAALGGLFELRHRHRHRMTTQAVRVNLGRQLNGRYPRCLPNDPRRERTT